MEGVIAKSKGISEVVVTKVTESVGKAGDCFCCGRRVGLCFFY